jgi:tRNA threonylcarbamoyladenosine biosynthesis protein TsaB
MRVLAVDTTSAHGSVALLDGDELTALSGCSVPAPRHAESLLPAIDDILARAGTSLDAIDGFAVAKGPGAFTGLRIGIAAVEGLSFATGRPVVGVSALDATAYRHRFVPGIVVSFLEAYRSEVYGAVYRAERGRVSLVAGPLCQPPTRFLDGIEEAPAIVCGTGLTAYRDLVRSRFPEAMLPEPSFFLAEELARLGREQLEAGEAAALGSLRALYIRPSDAERAGKTA